MLILDSSLSKALEIPTGTPGHFQEEVLLVFRPWKLEGSLRGPEGGHP